MCIRDSKYPANNAKEITSRCISLSLIHIYNKEEDSGDDTIHTDKGFTKGF